MKIANGQVIYTKANNSDTDGDRLKDGKEIIRRNADKGYFLLNSNPVVVDSDNDGLSDDKDPEPHKHFDKRFMLVDNFDYVPSVEVIDRHYAKGKECYNNKFLLPTDKAKWKMFAAASTAATVTPAMQLFIQASNAGSVNIKEFSNISAMDFSKMLGWYLTGIGLDYKLSNNDMAEIIYSQRNNYEHMVYNIQRFKNAAEEIVTDNGEKYISTSGGNDFKVACYKAINCGTHMASVGYDDSFAANWGYAIGEALGGMTGKVSLSNGIYRAQIKYYLIDSYEFPVHWDKSLRESLFNVWAHIVQMYVNTNNLENDNLVYWVTGHSRGAAIANIIGADYEKAGKKAFTYTFAAPNTTLTYSKYGSSKKIDYKTIFNVINEDDFVPCLPCSAWGYSRYGRTSTGQSIANSYEKEWENFTGILDYNPDMFGMDKTIASLADLISGDPRVDCYKYTCSCHGDGSDNSITAFFKEGTMEEQKRDLSSIPTNALPYCKIEYGLLDSLYTAFNFEVCQTPSYYMQILATVMAGKKCTLKLASKYTNSLIGLGLSSSKLTGGFEHPHYVESYYVLSKKAEVE